MCYKSLAFTVGRRARYVKHHESNKYPHAEGKSDSQYTWFHMGVLEGWLASQLQPFSPAAYLQLFIPRYWSFPQQPIYYTRSEYVRTGRSVTFPMERNLNQFNAFYDLPHYPGYTLITCSTPAARLRIQSILYPQHYPRKLRDNSLWQYETMHFATQSIDIVPHDALNNTISLWKTTLLGLCVIVT